MAIQEKFPSIRPSLNLDFANTKTLDPRVTFTRNSSATYFGSDGLLKTASANEPRIDYDPVTGECKGFLVEESRTNLLTYSEQFDNAAWIKIRSSVTVNATTAPDGTLTADKLIATNTSGDHFLLQRKPENRNITYSATVFAKAAEFSKLRVHILPTGASANRVAAKFDLYAGTVYETRNEGDGGGVTASIMGVGGGWYRCSVSGIPSTSNAGTATEILVSIINNSGQEFGWAGNGTSGIYIWGAQLEAGAFPTSYIPTPATFTSRNSTGTYFDSTGVMRTAAINTPRYDHGYVNRQWVSKGLLLEGASTNLLKYSEQFDNASWSKINASVAGNAAGAPDGTMTADRLVENTAAGVQHFVTSNAFTVTPSSTYAASIFVRAESRSRGRLRFGTNVGFVNAVVFDLSTATIQGGGSSTSSISSIGGGWYRVTVIGVTQTNAATANVQIFLHDNSGNEVYTGDGTSGIYIWGAQLEAGSQPTSYIKTEGTTVTRAADLSTSSQVTRAADSAVMTGANFSSWYRQDEGTVLVESSYTLAAGFNYRFDFNDGTSSNQNRLRSAPSGTTQSRLEITSGGVLTTQLSPATTNALGNKEAVAYKTNDVAIVVNGGVANSDSTVVLPVVGAVSIGSARTGGATFLNGHVKKMAYYPRRLPNDQLQALTK